MMSCTVSDIGVTAAGNEINFTNPGQSRQAGWKRKCFLAASPHQRNCHNFDLKTCAKHKCCNRTEVNSTEPKYRKPPTLPSPQSFNAQLARGERISYIVFREGPVLAKRRISPSVKCRLKDRQTDRQRGRSVAAWPPDFTASACETHTSRTDLTVKQEALR